MTATMTARHMRCWIQRKTWAAAACWQLLIALQFPRDECFFMGRRTPRDLETLTEADEKIIPDITGLDVPLVMGNRLREPIIKAIQETAEVSWDRKQKGSVKDEDVPLPSEELRRLESLFFNRYKLRIPAGEDTGEKWRTA